MAQIIPAIKGKLGSTEYYVVTMKAAEVASQLRVPKEIEGWDDLGVEEQYQREINETRVKKVIAPYLANDPDHFFGALIVAIMNSDNIAFEGITDIAPKMPQAYKIPASNIGFLTLSGGEVLVPLDGQHRLRAIKYAIDGKDVTGKDIEGLAPSIELAQEDITVILLKFDSQKARKIFNKVNRYAKPTTKVQNLITDDDDVIAVITRQIANDLINSRMVNFNNNTLSDKSKEFTTLATLYDSVDYIIETSHKKINKAIRPKNNEEKMYQDEANSVWQMLIDNIDHFQVALTDTEETGDEKRRQLRKESLLAKPITQLCLVRAFMAFKVSKASDGRTPTEEEICNALNKIDWSMTNDVWQKILMNGTKIMAGKGTVNLASSFIAYFAGISLNDKEENDLLNRYKKSFLDSEQKNIILPEKFVAKL